MSVWSLTIVGYGPHHNGNAAFDADFLAREFVKALKRSGHTINTATFSVESDDVNAIEVVGAGQVSQR